MTHLAISIAPALHGVVQIDCRSCNGRVSPPCSTKIGATRGDENDKRYSEIKNISLNRHTRKSTIYYNVNSKDINT
jgi:hypothetical protein